MSSSSRSERKARNNHHPNDSASKLFGLILVCFFGSGLTGLVYQILWARMIVKIIGSAPFAVTIVLTVFMGGLATLFTKDFFTLVKDRLDMIYW